jgi:hypothetical protein
MFHPFALAATALILPTLAGAAELPPRKAGLWEQTMTFEGRSKLPPRTMQLCVDAKTDKMLNDKFSGASGDACSKRDVKTSGDTITVDSVCNFGAGTTTSHTVVTGSFERAYTMRITSTRQGGPQTPGTTPGQATQMTLEAKWLGACKPDQKPGDVTMANGMKMNVLDAPARPAMPTRPAPPPR